MGTHTIQLQQLEIRRGHDGLLRGDPEVVLLVFAYALPEMTAAGEKPGDEPGQGSERNTLPSLLAERVDVPAKSPFPTTATLDHTFEVTTQSDGAIALLLVAMEEDNGDDIARIQQTLQSGRGIRLWPDKNGKDGNAESTLLGALPWKAPTACDIETPSGALSVSCGWDDWIAAAAWRADTFPSDSIEVPFVSRNGKNDWRLRVKLT